MLQGGLKGVEKESLRVTPEGTLAQTPHPRALGSALTHEHITTDYSEALIELVTPAFRESWELLQYLCDLHQFVYRHLGDELLWATSMPCIIDGDASIPDRALRPFQRRPDERGVSPRARPSLRPDDAGDFRRALQLLVPCALLADARGGARTARCRSGLSFPSNTSRLLRNYRRYGWLMLYLFGNSPALCASFVSGREHSLQRAQSPGTLYEPYATSLRMSDLGYRNKNQAGVQISVNSLDDYVRDLTRAVSTPHPEYEKIGVKVDGEYRQLNANLLQIENEYYSYIRPKRVARSGEHPSQALKRGGVEYVEFRALDVSAFDPVGVNQNKLRFLEAFAALCVLKDSAPIDAGEQDDAGCESCTRRASRARARTCAQSQRQPVELAHLGPRADRFDARYLRAARSGRCAAPVHSGAGAAGSRKSTMPALTPSARSLKELQETGESFAQFALRMSGVHKAYFLDLYPPNEQRLAEFAAEAEESLEQQAASSAPMTSLRSVPGRLLREMTCSACAPPLEWGAALRQRVGPQPVRLADVSSSR